MHSHATFAGHRRVAVQSDLEQRLHARSWQICRVRAGTASRKLEVQQGLPGLLHALYIMHHGLLLKSS